MAEVIPFRGILYDPARAGPIDRLLAPPYDVISGTERAALAAKSPWNFVRLILPEGDGDQKYAQAAADLQRWLDDGVLRRDGRRALYRYHQQFQIDAQVFVRKGFIARIRLQRFEERVVLPHERTLSGPKLDRLKLKRACRTHLSQVFGLYEDPVRAVDREFEEVESGPPLLEATTDDGVVHRLFRLVDPGAHQRVTAEMANKKVYIADGHHRYETMLALRDELRPLARSPRSSVEYGTICLTSVDDPGLVVLPTHRVVHGLDNFALPVFLDRLRARFQIEELKDADPDSLRARLALEGREAVCFILSSGARLFLLALRPGQEAPGAEPMRQLDVAVLHALILEEILGIDREAQLQQTNLRYVKELTRALHEARSPQVQAVFLLNPTRVDQLQAVADAGEVMPQKSTFFFPKLASGLVLNPIIPDEEATGTG
jgi:uncharacterized protein (DUF1015 family)